MYTINSVHNWTRSTDADYLKMGETSTTLDRIVSTNYTHKKHALRKRIAATISALSLVLGLGVAGMACDKGNGGQDDGGVDACTMYCDSGNGSEGGNSEGGSNHPPNAIDDGSVTPPNNGSYNVGDTIPTGFTSPSDPDGDSLDGKVVLSAPSQSFTHEFPLGTLTPGQHYGIDIDTATANGGSALPATSAGTAYTIELVVSDGKGGESKVQRGVTLVGLDPNKAVVDYCNVSSSNVGVGISMDCHGHDPQGRSLVGQWHLLTNDPAGITLSPTGHLGGPVMSQSNVGLHTYVVTVLDSPEYSFTVPVDEHRSSLMLNCSGGTIHDLLLPETTVDTVSEACFTGYNAGLKPSANGQPNYIGDVDPTCAHNALQTVSITEQKAWKNYNDKETPFDVFSSCTVTNPAQVKYHHD